MIAMFITFIDRHMIVRIDDSTVAGNGPLTGVDLAEAASI